MSTMTNLSPTVSRQTCDKEVAKVFRTYNYNKFKTMLGNRQLRNRPAKIIASIQRNGYIMCPIIVNEKGEVIDGQGRLEALRTLELPVDYIIVKGATLNDCIAMNAQTTPWTLIDYVESYKAQGIESYIRLAELHERHSNISVQTIASITAGLYGSGSKSPKVGQKAIKNGELEISEEDYCRSEMILNYIDRLIPTLRKVGGSVQNWSLALAFCYNLSSLDNERLYKQVIEMRKELHPGSTVKSIIADFEDVYNYKCRNKEYISAEYDKHCCAKMSSYRQRWCKDKED